MGSSQIIYSDQSKDQYSPGIFTLIKSAFHLPHFSRRITAPTFGVKFYWLILIMLAALCAVNLVFEVSQPADEEKKLQQLILRNPQESRFHEKLGEYYLTINKDAAKREFDLAQEYYQFSFTPPINILGAELQPADRFREIEVNREKIKKEIAYWENISFTYPQYSYSIMKTAVLYYLLDDKVKTKELTALLQQQMPEDANVRKIVDKLKI